jgi:hypothetical protein
MAKVTVMISQTWDTNDFIDDETPEEIDLESLIDLAYNRFAEDVDYMVKYDEVRANIVHIVEEEF